MHFQQEFIYLVDNIIYSVISTYQSYEYIWNGFFNLNFIKF